MLQPKADPVDARVWERLDENKANPCFTKNSWNVTNLLRHVKQETKAFNRPKQAISSESISLNRAG